MRRDIERVLWDEKEIAAKVAELGAAITKDYQGKTPLLVGVLKGSFVFMADLARRIDLPCEVDFMSVSSYGKKSETTGAVRIIKDLDANIEGRDILVVEDILDSGVTLSYIMSVMRVAGPASIALCTLLDKPSRRQVPVELRYKGFETPDEFVVGYGLDYAGRYRNLPYIGVLKRSIYETDLKG
ncbi:MAG: hypoxanthine phosphoribosyltransferase [Oscillospiraceae bacterium]|jgi:hypoxanthine phosphoribosyltransferase|nr:hypoxanthine phosphoribosyltransferase [Oscillospiraceae bacterium]